jgi:hypothetical protein
MAGTSRSAQHKRSERTSLLTSLILVLPLLLFYEVGVIFCDSMNGADLITQNLLSHLGLRGFLIFQGALLVVLVGTALILRRKQEFRLRSFIPIVLESGIYALTLGTLIVFVMTELLRIDPRLAAGVAPIKASIFERLVMSAGAGFHEELLFRLLIMGGLIAFLDRVLKLKAWISVVLAIAISSALFSAAHHLGALGEPLRFGVFVYRAIAGVFFAVLYRFRSFGIAVYTHTLYDVYVLLLH